MKYHISLLSVALAVCVAAPLSAQTLATWDFPVKVTASSGALTKTSGCAGCPDSGAHSTPQLTGDGYVEFVAPAIEELFAGLGSDLSSSTAATAIDYAFSLQPGGAWEVRELGVYKSDGTYAAGDRFRVAVENGVVVYRHNGVVVYTSQIAPSYPLVLDVTLLSLNASIAQAAVVTASATTTSTTTSTTTTSGGTTTTTTTSGTTTAAGTYVGVTDRNAYAKPAVPALGPANSKINDPVFQSQITRITDAGTRPGLPNRSYRTPSSPHQNAWSANGTYFYVVSGDGSIIPFTFDAPTATASRINPTSSGAGGATLNFYIEPGFSYVDDNVIYGSVAGGNLHTIDQYNFATDAYTRLFDLESIVSGLSGTYIGGVSSSAGATERIMVMFGGTSQDHHHYVLIFDKANPANRVLMDTWASTVNGQPSSIPLNFSLHHVAIDRSGRYIMMYPTWADQSGTRKAPQSVAWDTQTGVITEMPVSTLPYGHDAFGYGVSVNQDCCVSTTWDAAQWQFRDLSRPTTTRDLLPIVLTPKEVYFEDHTTWNNARPDALLPVISSTFRYGNNTTAWRALDDEIIAIETDKPNQDPTIWRFAHHRSNTANDTDPSSPMFWYEPRANVSHDGRWVLFTSNWEKTLGAAADSEPGMGYRQDVFLVQLKTNDSGTTTPPPPVTVVPVVIAAATLPAGVVGSAYSATLSASGGSGTFSWSVTGGALPGGLTLDASTGTIAGTPSAAGSFAFTVTAADAADATNTASAGYAITVTAPIVPVVVTTTTLPGGQVGTAYSASLTASGGSGSYAWSVSSGTLPAGLTLNTSTGAISGTPTTAGTFAFSVTAADAADTANSATAAYSVTIAAAPVTGTLHITSPRALPNAKLGVFYSYQVTAVNVTGTPKWSIAGGSLPPGIKLDAVTGLLSGTPTKKATFNFNVRITDAVSSDTLTLTIAVK